MSITDGIEKTLGKTIKAIIINEGIPTSPLNQLFLVFTDDTHYEICGDMHFTGGIDKGGLDVALQYAKKFPARNRTIIKNK